MNGPRFRITVTRMMVLIACVAVALAAFRIHLSLGSFVAAVVVLGVWRMFEIGDSCRDGGVPLSVVQWMLTLISSLGVASLMVGFSTFLALSVYAIGGIFRGTHPPYNLSPEHMLMILAALGSGGFAANKIRPQLWPSGWASRRLRDQVTKSALADHASVDLERGPQ